MNVNAKELLEAAVEAAALVGGNTPAFAALFKRVGAAAGEKDPAKLEALLADAVKGRKAAHKGMQEAGKARG